MQRMTFSRGAKSAPQAIVNIRENCKRDLPWFVELSMHEGHAVAVSGGPSLRGLIKEVRARKKIRQCIAAVNGARRFLIANGVQPDLVAFVDTSPVVCGFIDDEPDQCLYLVASSCHPSVFDKLKNHKVLVWHQDFEHGQPEREQVEEIMAAYPDKPSTLIGGGSTAGLRIMNLLYLLGFRTWHHYGLDSSYADDGSDHAYTKHDGVEPEWREIVMDGKRYRGSPWMLRQAEEFKEMYELFLKKGCDIHVHGEGLIPDMWKIMREIQRAA